MELGSNTYEKLMDIIRDTVHKLRNYHSNDVILIHHDDADGITSAALVKLSLEELDYKVKEVCLEKMYPQALKIIHEQNKDKIIIYVDIGSPHAAKIFEMDKGKNFIIILDHHDAPYFQKDTLININSEFFGFNGESESSGATLSYIFAKNLTERIVQFSHLALIGSYEIPGPIRGLNKIPLEDSIKQKLVKKTSSERYLIKTISGYIARSTLSKYLTILGSVGYYKGGPRLGIEACIENFPKYIIVKSKELENERKKLSKRLLNKLYQEGLHESQNIQWFFDYDFFKGMGTKVIGTFCS